MAYKQKGHYGKYSGNAKHSRHHMVNSWEEEDVKRGKEEMKEGNKGHAEALFNDAHGSYNYDGENSPGAEHNNSPANFFTKALDFHQNAIRKTRGGRGTMTAQDANPATARLMQRVVSPYAPPTLDTMNTLGNEQQQVQDMQQQVQDPNLQ